MSLFLLNFVSCSFKNSDIPIFKSDSEQVTKRITNLFIAIKNDDKRACKDLFTEKVRNSKDFDKKIEELFEYCNGEIIACEENALQTSSSSEYGKKSKKFSSSFEIKTSEADYRIAIYDIVYDDFDSNNCGLLSLYVIKSSEDTDLTYTYWGDGKETSGINIGIKNKLW